MLFSKKTKIYLLIIVLLTLMSISEIHAIDFENTTEKNDQITVTDNITHNDKNLNENTPGTFDELNKDITTLSPGDVYNITKDYQFTSCQSGNIGEHPGITISTNNITINGNGHIIDGNHQSALFKITGNDVKIFNLTLINGEYHGSTVKINAVTKNNPSGIITYYYTNDLSPVYWKGSNGLISNCVFYGNTAIDGGAITWDGRNGIINNSLFFNNTASGIGGAIYVTGKNNTIKNSIFINSSSQLSGEAIYIDRNQKNYNITGVFVNCKPFIDGKITNIDVDYLRYSVYSLISDKKVDLIKMLYSSIANNYTHYYCYNTIYFSGYNGTDFVLNFARNFDDIGIIYAKTYHFTDISNYNAVFNALLREEYKNELTYIKNMMVYNKKDYESAMKADDSVFKSESFVKTIEDDLKSMPSYSTYKELLITFAGQYTINSKATWKPSNKFDIISINGNGSKISVSTDDSDECKWVHIKDTKCQFIVSDLTIEGFNMAVENLGGICIFNNVLFNHNRMDYWFVQDYGASICNTGTCICNNCTFTNNYCKNGGAIFSQGYLEVNNCTFKNNKAYGHGNNICNADKGTVKVDGIKINGTQGLVYHAKSLSKKEITVLSVLTTCFAGAIGFTVGTLCGSPVLGLVVGGLAGAAVGACAAAYICSQIYDLNFDRTTLCAVLIVSCTLAGAAGGAFGGYLTQVPADIGAGLDMQSQVYLVSSEGSSSSAGEVGSILSDSTDLISLDDFNINEEILEEILEIIK